MIEFEIGPALAAGFVATVVMTLMMNGAKAAGMTEMPRMPLMMGSMFTGDRKKAMTMGGMAHFVMMGTILFGVVYAALFTAFDDASWWLGALIGAAHGAVIGLMAMPMMPSMHPRMSTALPGTDGRTVVETGGQVQLAAPGVLGSRWGGMTPVGLVMGHVVYGLVVALVYTWLT
jgi:hypothetical protein